MRTPRSEGPRAWAASAAVGAVVGVGISRFITETDAPSHPEIPLWLCGPFAALLLAIALMPFIAHHWWHRHYPSVSLFLGGLVAACVVAAFTGTGYAGHQGHAWGAVTMLHAGAEYYSFLALVGGLYIVSGGLVIDVSARGRPVVNTILLAAGAVLANIIGTTGASMLLLRPFMRVNAGRLTGTHVVFFILIVSNCGGALTPIGDPPLYLGFLKGVPFFWTLTNLWPDWLLVVGLLLAIFFAFDSRSPAAAKAPSGPAFRVRGRAAAVGLVLIVAGVFVDPVLKSRFGVEGYPIGATFQWIVAIVCYMRTPRHNRHANEFSFEPFKEVALLFAGIFATMAPVLAYLGAHGPELGLTSPTAFYFATGSLSAVLDNAPTYLNFLQISLGDRAADPASIAELISTGHGSQTLHAISNAAVFFGALTYIGNGPNFMVKAIAERAGVKMPGFFGYLTVSLIVLSPVLVVHWAVFIR